MTIWVDAIASSCCKAMPPVIEQTDTTILYTLHKERVFKTVVRTAITYSAETWAVKKAQEKKLDAAEMWRILRWMSRRQGLGMK